MGRLNLSLRMKILARDGYKCVYCGATPARAHLQVDHVVPRSRGGSDHSTNLVTSCFDCNNGKRADDLPLPAGITPGPVGERPRFRLKAGRVFDYRFDDFRPYQFPCDDCGQSADTVHWPTWPAEGNLQFACPRHDPGGYWLAIPDLFSGPQDFRHHSVAIRYTGIDHLRDTKPEWMVDVLMRRLVGATAVSA